MKKALAALFVLSFVAAQSAPASACPYSQPKTAETVKKPTVTS